MEGGTIVLLDATTSPITDIPSIILSLPETINTDLTNILEENNNPRGLMVPGGRKLTKTQATTPKLSTDELASIMDIFSG